MHSWKAEEIVDADVGNRGKLRRWFLQQQPFNECNGDG